MRERLKGRVASFALLCNFEWFLHRKATAYFGDGKVEFGQPLEKADRPQPNFMNPVTVSRDFAHFPGNVKGRNPRRGMSKTWVAYLYFLSETVSRPKQRYGQIVKAADSIR